MTDYTELVKALRCENHPCKECEYILWFEDEDANAYTCDEDRLHHDAAAAIEELQQIADHYEQTAKDYWKEACDYKAQLPKRGEWLNVTDSYSWYGKCSVCGEEFVVDAYYAGGMNYCPNCGADMRKTEVQE